MSGRVIHTFISHVSLSMTIDVAQCDTDAWLGLKQQLLASPNGHPSVIALPKKSKH